MEVTSVDCPECKQKILNPVAVDDKLRCGGCGHVFALENKPPGLDGNAPTPPEKQRPVLGKEPASGTYGLLFVLAWAMVVVSLITFGWQLYGVLVLTNAQIAAASSFGPSHSLLIQGILSLVRNTMCALAGICFVSFFERLDASATWLAWRSGAQAEAIGNPPGSSLPYILPWTVSGGVLVVMGMVEAISQSADPENSPAALIFGGTMATLAAGSLLFMMGLGCGELRRFFWRMAQLGKPLPKRNRGTEAGIGEPLRVHGGIFRSNAPVFVLIGMPLLLTALGVMVWMYFEFYGALIRTAVTGRTVVTLGGALLAILGGTFTMYKLSNLWGDLLYHWEFSAASIEHKKLLRSGWKASQGFVIIAWTVGGLIILTQVILFLTATTDLPASVKTLSLCASALTTLFVGWLARLKSDSLRLRNACSDIGHKQHFSDGAWSRGLARVLIFIAVADFGWTVYQSYVVIDTVGATMMSSGGGRGMAATWIASTALMMLIGIATSCLPALWFALVLLDFNHAAGNLAAVEERAT